jgi:hypothetical protein
VAIFRIPKQTDRSLIQALKEICEEARTEFKVTLNIRVRSFDGPGAQDFQVPDAQHEKFIDRLLAADSQIVPHFWLRSAGNNNALAINRAPTSITDEVHVASDQNWFNQLEIPQDHRPSFVIELIRLARKKLKAADTEGSLVGDSDSAWSRYRDSQQAILNSLQETQRTILSEFARKSLEMEAAYAARTQERELGLQTHYQSLEEQLTTSHNAEVERLAEREKVIEQREKSFNTKEARYVARNEQQKQIEQIQGWLENWSLTRGTRSKRNWVVAGYIAGIIVSGIAAWWYSSQSMRVITVSNGNLPWWQWGLLALKSIFPLAACITFIVAFIRWSSDWAKQHADEEFRNRARVLDIGRTAWLLEAVRDAQDNNKELPIELLKELSRNLFAYAPTGDATDLHPQSVGDLVAHGLSSVRLKGPDGSEIEAKRGKA